MLGELGLDGSVRGVSGVLCSVMMAREQGLSACIIPAVNLEEARNVEGIHLIGVNSLEDLLSYCRAPENYEY